VVLCDAHLFVLQIHASSFGTSWWGEIVQHRNAFHGLGVQDVTEFHSDGCSVFCLLGGEERERERKREREREAARGLFS
jgi:hypothetical protein